MSPNFSPLSGCWERLQENKLAPRAPSCQAIKTIGKFGKLRVLDLNLLAKIATGIAPVRCQALRNSPLTQCQSNTRGTFTPPSTLGGGHHHLHDRDTGRDISKANFKMTARTSAASSTIDVDVDSPGNKRPCPSPSNQESTPWTLEMFQSAIQPLITKVGNMKTRLGQVEAAFTERMQEQVNLLTATTHTQSQHTADLIGLQQQDKVNQETFTEIKKRETTPAVLPPRANSSTTADERRPELIMGGWADDQDASVTLQLAKDAVATSNSTWTCREPLCRGLDVDTWWFHMRPGNMSPKATYTVASQQPSRK